MKFTPADRRAVLDACTGARASGRPNSTLESSSTAKRGRRNPGATAGMVTEAQFQRQVIQLARLMGWRCASFRPARVRRGGVEQYETPVGADGKGWPDLVLVRCQVLFVELKTDGGTLRPEQQAWQRWLDRAGGICEVWRPSDWPYIERTLAR